jgi:hypothetical protein
LRTRSWPIGSCCPVSGHSGQPDKPGELREAMRRRGRARSWLHRVGTCEASGVDRSAKLDPKLPVVFVANFFAFTLRHAMVAAAMRTRYDQFGKQMVRIALEAGGAVETDAEGWPTSTRFSH